MDIDVGRYCYCVLADGNKVKFVIADYLAVEICINIVV